MALVTFDPYTVDPDTLSPEQLRAGMRVLQERCANAAVDGKYHDLGEHALEIIWTIASYLNLGDLMSLSRTCKEYFDLLWHSSSRYTAEELAAAEAEMWLKEPGWVRPDAYAQNLDRLVRHFPAGKCPTASTILHTPPGYGGPMRPAWVRFTKKGGISMMTFRSIDPNHTKWECTTKDLVLGHFRVRRQGGYYLSKDIAGYTPGAYESLRSVALYTGDAPWGPIPTNVRLEGAAAMFGWLDTRDEIVGTPTVKTTKGRTRIISGYRAIPRPNIHTGDDGLPVWRIEGMLPPIHYDYDHHHPF